MTNELLTSEFEYFYHKLEITRINSASNKYEKGIMAYNLHCALWNA